MTAHADPTFTAYSPAQAQAYALGRSGSYPAALYNLILNHHQHTGGLRTTLLDVGCGHGKATTDLSPSFHTAVGIDPSDAMIATARSLGGRTATGQPTRFEVGDAEASDEVAGVEAGTVDLVTAAMSAHWFDLGQFWAAAARVLRPGGTVAVWTCGSLYVHTSMPERDRLQEILFRLEREMLEEFELPGNRLSRDGYVNLPLPWQVRPVVDAFDKETFVRYEWNKDGEVKPDEPFFSATAIDGKGFEEESLDDLERGLDTASMVSRWRTHHKDLAGTDEDCVKKTIGQLREVIGDQKLRTGNSTSLLLFKRK